MWYSDLAAKLPKYYGIVYLLFLLSKARQAKTEHMEMKILQLIFGISVILTKNELTKICNEPGIRPPSIHYSAFKTDMMKVGLVFLISNFFIT